MSVRSTGQPGAKLSLQPDARSTEIFYLPGRRGPASVLEAVALHASLCSSQSPGRNSHPRGRRRRPLTLDCEASRVWGPPVLPMSITGNPRVVRCASARFVAASFFDSLASLENAGCRTSDGTKPKPRNSSGCALKLSLPRSLSSWGDLDPLTIPARFFYKFILIYPLRTSFDPDGLANQIVHACTSSMYANDGLVLPHHATREGQVAIAVRSREHVMACKSPLHVLRRAGPKKGHMARA